MNVVEPKLLPSEYGAANELKTQVQRAKDYMHLHPDAAGTDALVAYFSAVAGEAAGGGEVIAAGDSITVQTHDGATEAVVSAVADDSGTLVVRLPSASGIVQNGDTFAATGGGTVTVAVDADGVVTMSYAA